MSDTSDTSDTSVKPDKYSEMLLWTFDKDGICTGYYLAENIFNLDGFIPLYPWEHIPDSVWRTDKDGAVLGYFPLSQKPILGTYKDFGTVSMMRKTNCRDYDGAHRCEKSRWNRCCCIGWGRNEEKIPGTCN